MVHTEIFKGSVVTTISSRRELLRKGLGTIMALAVGAVIVQGERENTVQENIGLTDLTPTSEEKLEGHLSPKPVTLFKDGNLPEGMIKPAIQTPVGNVTPQT